MTHTLKTWPQYYKEVVSGVKPFEVRKNDRHFKTGDTIILQEYDPEKERYSGQETEFVITYMLIGGSFGIQEGYIVMAIKPKEHYC